MSACRRGGSAAQSAAAPAESLHTCSYRSALDEPAECQAPSSVDSKLRREIEEIVVSSRPAPSSRTRPPVNHRLTVCDSPWQRRCSIEKNGPGIHIGLFKSEGVLGLERLFAPLDIYRYWLLAAAWMCTRNYWRYHLSLSSGMIRSSITG